MDSAEFDHFAEEYDKVLSKTVAVTGEDPDFFHEYKIRELQRLALRRNVQPESILDFGSGVGNSIPHFHRYFPEARLSGADVSLRSLELAEARFPGMSTGIEIDGQRIAAEDDSFGLVFSACVFHHIPHDEHIHWLSELYRVTRKGGMIGIFEHNPLNPLTVYAVKHCPLDDNAHLIRAKELVERYRESGWKEPQVTFHLFFPRALAGLRRIEPFLGGVPFGAQYSVTAIKADSRIAG